MTEKKYTPAYNAEFRERAVRLVHDNRADYASDNAAYRAIAPRLGCSRTSGENLFVVLLTDPSSQELGSPTIPGRFSGDWIPHDEWVKRKRRR